MVSTIREEGAELFMRNWHENKRDAKPQSDAQRLRQRHPPSESLSGRGEGGGGRGGKGGGRRMRGAMPKRLKSGSGHQRLETCGISNGRH